MDVLATEVGGLSASQQAGQSITGPPVFSPEGAFGAALSNAIGDLVAGAAPGGAKAGTPPDGTVVIPEDEDDRESRLAAALAGLLGMMAPVAANLPTVPGEAAPAATGSGTTGAENEPGAALPMNGGFTVPLPPTAGSANPRPAGPRADTQVQSERFTSEAVPRFSVIAPPIDTSRWVPGDRGDAVEKAAVPADTEFLADTGKLTAEWFSNPSEAATGVPLRRDVEPAAGRSGESEGTAFSGAPEIFGETPAVNTGGWVQPRRVATTAGETSPAGKGPAQDAAGATADNLAGPPDASATGVARRAPGASTAGHMRGQIERASARTVFGSSSADPAAAPSALNAAGQPGAGRPHEALLAEGAAWVPATSARENTFAATGPAAPNASEGKTGPGSGPPAPNRWSSPEASALAPAPAPSSRQGGGSPDQPREHGSSRDAGPGPSPPYMLFARTLAAGTAATYAPGSAAEHPASASQSPDVPTTESGPLMPSIVRTLTLQRREGGGEAHVRLQPDHLGELSVTLRVEGARVTAILRADSPVVRAWVQAHQQELRSALEDQGLTLDKLVVDPDGDGRQNRQDDPAQDRRPHNRRRSPASRFEALM